MSEQEEVLLVSASGAVCLMEVERGRTQLQFVVRPKYASPRATESLDGPDIPDLKTRTYQCRGRRIYVFEEVE